MSLLPRNLWLTLLALTGTANAQQPAKVTEQRVEVNFSEGHETAASEGEKTHRSVDLLGRVYEYSLTRFASAEGKNGGQLYTPSYVVRCLVEMLAPYKGRIYEPACGYGSMFLNSETFVESHGGVAKCEVRSASVEVKNLHPFVIRNSLFDISPARRLAVMNFALRGIEAEVGLEHTDTFRRDLHPDLRADYVLANPPFNDSDWFCKDDDLRWQLGVPPKGNATATRASVKTTPAKPDRRSVGETKLHYLWLQLFHPAVGTNAHA